MAQKNKKPTNYIVNVAGIEIKACGLLKGEKCNFRDKHNRCSKEGDCFKKSKNDK